MTNSNISLPPSKKIPNNKFLPWNLRVCNKNVDVYSFIRAKRFSLKKFIDHSPEEQAFMNDYAFISKLFKNSKIYKTLHHVQVSSFFQPYVHEKLKNSKNLKTYGFEFDTDEMSLEKLVFYIRKLPPTVQFLQLFLSQKSPMENRDIYNIARSARRFPKLQSFKRKEISDDVSDKTYVQKELITYSHSVSRLKEMKRMIYTVDRDNQAGFQRAMRRGVMCPGITGLKLNLSPRQFRYFNPTRRNFDAEDQSNNDELFDFANLTDEQKCTYAQVKKNFVEEESEKNDDIDMKPFVKILNFEEEETVIDPLAGYFHNDEKFIPSCIMREELRPFYRFELFPDLKELTIRQSGILYPLDSFVIDGFKALRNLESLKITIIIRSMRTAFLFKGLLQLPLLKNFTLEIGSLETEHWALLGHFIHIQSKLESFRLWILGSPSSRHDYLQQSSYFQSTVEYLENKPFLKSLDLDFSSISLGTLSKGLSQLTMKNQLQTFKFKVCDHPIFSQEKAKKRIEGLCKFLSNQKESLKKLHIELPIALDDAIVTQIAEAVSQLSQLTELHFTCNWNFEFTMRNLMEIFESEISLKMEKKLVMPKEWNPNLARYFKKLKNLENFTFHVSIHDSTRWFLDIMTMLASLEKLRKLEISVWIKWLSYGIQENIASVLLDLKNVKEVHVYLQDDSDQSSLKEIVKRINQRQSRKSDFMCE